MKKIVLTAPHGNEYLNDVIAKHIAETLRDKLLQDDWGVSNFINVLPRSSGDMNRPKTRDTIYRNMVRNAISCMPNMVLDIHGYPPDTDSPMRKHEMVVLRSYKEGQAEFAEKYYNCLCQVNKGQFDIGIQNAEAENDIVREALEFKVPAVLVEHVEDGPVGAFANIHFEALKLLFGGI